MKMHINTEVYHRCTGDDNALVTLVRVNEMPYEERAQFDHGFQRDWKRFRWGSLACPNCGLQLKEEVIFSKGDEK